MTTDLLSKLDIEDLLVRYNHAMDSGDIVAFADLWTPDAECGDKQGVDAIVQALASTHGKFAELHHLSFNILIDLDGDSGRVRSKSLSARRLTGEQQKAEPQFIWYEDLVKRIDGRWLFASRCFGIVG
jgi:hypothetical protein